MKAVAGCCHDSLTQLDVSRCARLNAESCGWLSGTLGAAPASFFCEIRAERVS